MVTISISELKRFLNNAKSIKDNKIIPILSYIRLECNEKASTLTKTNLNSFVVTEIEADFKKNVIILIEEQTLSGCVNYSRGKEIKISISGKNVVLNDGFREVKCQHITDPFPSIESNTSDDKFEFNRDILSSLSVAKSHALAAADKSIREWKCFIHMLPINGKSHVVGVNGAVSYFKSFKGKLPKISIDPETVSIISNFPQVEYRSNDRYDFFSHLGTTYGFIKSETSCPQFETVLEKFKSENSFVINRKELVGFCEMTVNINGSSVPPEVCLRDAGKEVLMTFDDISGNQSASETLNTDNKTFMLDDIFFLPKNMLIVLKELKADKIKISKIFGNMIISTDEEKDYLGSVMELAKN